MEDSPKFRLAAFNLPPFLFMAFSLLPSTMIHPQYQPGLPKKISCEMGLE